MKTKIIASLLLTFSISSFASARENCLPISGWGGDIIYGGEQGVTFKNDKEKVITQQLQTIYNDSRFSKARAELAKVYAACGGQESVEYTLREDLSEQSTSLMNIVEMQVNCKEKSSDPQLDGTSVYYIRINMSQPELSCSSLFAG